MEQIYCCVFNDRAEKYNLFRKELYGLIRRFVLKIVDESEVPGQRIIELC